MGRIKTTGYAAKTSYHRSVADVYRHKAALLRGAAREAEDVQMGLCFRRKARVLDDIAQALDFPRVRRTWADVYREETLARIPKEDK